MRQLLLIIKMIGGARVARVIFEIAASFYLIEKAAKMAMWPLKKITQIATKALSIIVSGLQRVYKYVVDTFSTIGGIIADQFTAAAEDFLEFEKEADRIFGLIATEVGVSFEQIQMKSVNISNEIGKTLMSVMKALFETVSAGFRKVDAAAMVVKAAGSLAQAGWIGVDEALKVLITTLNAYGISADRAYEASALLYQTQVQGRGTMDQFAKLLGNVLPIASAYGVSLEEAAATTAAVTKVMGMHGRVMFSIVAALRHLQEPTASTTEAWKRYNYQAARTVAGNVDVRKSFERLREVRRVFGDESIRHMFKHQAALRGIAVVTGLEVGVFNEVFDALANATQQVERFGTAVASTQSRTNWILGRWVIRFSNMRIVVFKFFHDAFQPVFKSVLEIVEESFQAINNFAEGSSWDRINQSLSGIVSQFMKSEFYKTLLEDLRRLLTSVGEVTGDWLRHLEGVAEHGDLLAHFNDWAKRYLELKEKIVKATKEWGEAWDAVSLKMREVLGWMGDALPAIATQLERLSTVGLPQWIASIEGFDIAGAAATGLGGLQTFWIWLLEVAPKVANVIVFIQFTLMNSIKVISGLITIISNLKTIVVQVVRAIYHAFADMFYSLMGIFNEFAALIPKIALRVQEIMPWWVPGRGRAIKDLTRYIKDYGDAADEAFTKAKKHREMFKAVELQSAAAQTIAATAAREFANLFTVAGRMPTPTWYTGATKLFEERLEAARRPGSALSRAVGYLKERSEEFQQGQRVTEVVNAHTRIQAEFVKAQVAESEYHRAVINGLEGMVMRLIEEEGQLKSQRVEVEQLGKMGAP